MAEPPGSGAAAEGSFEPRGSWCRSEGRQPRLAPALPCLAPAAGSRGEAAGGLVLPQKLRAAEPRPFAGLVSLSLLIRFSGWGEMAAWEREGVGFFLGALSGCSGELCPFCLVTASLGTALAGG